MELNELIFSCHQVSNIVVWQMKLVCPDDLVAQL
jgi:hypothetical protein